MADRGRCVRSTHPTGASRLAVGWAICPPSRVVIGGPVVCCGVVWWAECPPYTCSKRTKTGIAEWVQAHIVFAMANRPSKDHHWWPVGLQSYWSDRYGDVSWIDPTGFVRKKRSANRKIGYKRHGHTSFRGTVWSSNFESDFDRPDNAVHEIVGALDKLRPKGTSFHELLKLIGALCSGQRGYDVVSNFYRMDHEIARNLLLLCLSLLIRSPSARSRYERYGTQFGFPVSEEVGKANIAQNYHLAQKICDRHHLPTLRFVLLNSFLGRFVFGDGLLDWITPSLLTNSIHGKALISLTPHLCVYMFTPSNANGSVNCASLFVNNIVEDGINDICQVYSKDQLFFRGRVPRLTDAYKRSVHLTHIEKKSSSPKRSGAHLR